jgi:hypothetical protein
MIAAEHPEGWRGGEPESCKKFGQTVKKWRENVKANFELVHQNVPFGGI